MVSNSYKATSSNMIGSFANAAGSGSENTLAERPTRRSFAFVIAFSMFLAAAPALAGKPTAEHGIKWHKTASLSKIGSFANADGSGAENLAYDPRMGRLFVTNTEANTVDVLSLRDPTGPTHMFTISAPSDCSGDYKDHKHHKDYNDDDDDNDDNDYKDYEVTDIDVHGGILAVTRAAPTVDAKGIVVFHDAVTGKCLRIVAVGFNPDELKFSPNGTKLAVSNSGDLDFTDDTTFVDPPGSISLIDLSRGIAKASVQSIDFSQFDGKEDKLRAKGIRIRPDAASSADLAPEGIAFAPHGELWVTLEQNNAIAIISVDKRRMKIKRLIPLGAKDHSLPGNGLDASDKDGMINIANWPVFGLYTPDEIGSFKIRGDTYFIITNEGDPTDIPVNGVRKDETIRVKDLGKDGEDGLDPSAFPNAKDLMKPEKLGRLQVSRFEGDTDDDGDKEVLYAYGARSFSILDDKGNLAFDSGDDFEQKIAARIHLPIDEYTLFNAPIDENTFDDRSDNRGPQPEGIAIGKVEGHTYAFIGLHTQGGIMAYDVSDPKNARFVDYINTRDPGEVAGGDLGTKGLAFISPDDSPTGKALIAAACSKSGTVAIYEFAIHRHGD